MFSEKEIKEIKEITRKINEYMKAELSMGYNSSKRIFGKDEDLKKYKCYQCAMQDFMHETSPNYPCSICKDRPTRKNDKSEFIPDLPDEIREEVSRQHKNEETGKGKYKY